MHIRTGYFLPPLLLTPKQEQEVSGPRLTWDEVPVQIRGASLLADRWILVRDNSKGISRFFVSPAFERDIVPWSKVLHSFYSQTATYYTHNLLHVQGSSDLERERARSAEFVHATLRNTQNYAFNCSSICTLQHSWYPFETQHRSNQDQVWGERATWRG
jgi:hypothetical protein